MLRNILLLIYCGVTLASNITVEIGVFVYVNSSAYQLPDDFLPADGTQLNIIYGLRVWEKSVLENGGIPLVVASNINYVTPVIKYYNIGDDLPTIDSHLTYYLGQFYYAPNRGLFQNMTIIVPPGATLATYFMQMCESSQACVIHSPLTNDISQAICQAADITNPATPECYGKLVNSRRFQYTWQYLPNYQYTMQELLNWIKSESLNIVIESVAFYYPLDSFGQQIYQSTLDIIEENKLTVVDIQYFNVTANASSTSEEIAKATNYFTNLLNNTMTLNPDVLLIGGDLTSADDCSRLINLMYQLNYMPKVVGFGGGCLQQVNNDITISSLGLSNYMFGVLPWDENVEGFLYHTVTSLGNWEQWASTSDNDAPKIYANYVRQYFMDLYGANHTVLEPEIVLMGIGSMTGIGIQKAIENSNTLVLTAATLTSASKNLYLPSFYGQLSYDLQGRVVLSPELVIQMQNQNEYNLITPYSVGVTPVIPIPTWNERVKHNVSMDSLQEYLITAVACVVICVIVYFIRFIYAFRKTNLIRGSTPIFCCLILIGALLLVVSIWTWPYRGATKSGCQAFLVLIHFGFALMIQSTIIKTYRLWRIFFRSDLSITKITTSDIIFGLSVALLIDGVFLIVWYSVSPIDITEIIVDPDRISLNYTTCSSGNSNFDFVMTSIAYHSLYIIFMLYISWKVRNIPDNFNETIYIAIGTYFGVFIMILVLGILLGGSVNNEVGYIVRSLGIIAIVCFTIGPLFWSKIRGVSDELHGVEPNAVTKVLSGPRDVKNVSNKSRDLPMKIIAYAADNKSGIQLNKPSNDNLSHQEQRSVLGLAAPDQTATEDK